MYETVEKLINLRDNEHNRIRDMLYMFDANIDNESDVLYTSLPVDKINSSFAKIANFNKEIAQTITNANRRASEQPKAIPSGRPTFFRKK